MILVDLSVSAGLPGTSCSLLGLCCALLLEYSGVDLACDVTATSGSRNAFLIVLELDRDPQRTTIILAASSSGERSHGGVRCSSSLDVCGCQARSFIGWIMLVVISVASTSSWHVLADIC